MKRGKRNFSLERLEKREVFSATVIEVEVNDTQAQANAFELDSKDMTAELVGTSQNDKDKDWFRFSVPEGGTLHATVASPNNEFAALEVERVNGTEVLSTDPNDGINSASGDVVAGETLFVRLRAKDDAAADYVANLALGEGGGPGGPGDPPTGVVTEIESNDRKVRANPFALDDSGAVQLLGKSTSDDDKDFFRFTMPQDGDLAITVSSPNNNFAQVQIEDRLGRDIFETDPSNGVNSGVVTLAGGEDYFVRMRSKTDGPAEYVVDLQASDPSGPIIDNGGKGGLSAGAASSGNTTSSNPVEAKIESQRTGATAQLATHEVENMYVERLSQADRHDSTDLAFAELTKF